MSGPITGLNTTYQIPDGTIVDIDEFIRTLNPMDTPLQSAVGSDGRSVLSTGTMTQVKKEWQDETTLTPRSTLGANVATTGETTVTVAAGHQLHFAIGDSLRINAEQVLVTGYGSGDDLTVTRGHAGTTAATHTAGDDVLGLGTQLPEGSDPSPARASGWNNRYNVSQILGPTQVSVSGTQNVIRRYGLTTSMFDFQIARRGAEDLLRLENQIIYGTRYEDAPSEIRQFGGLDYWITTNIDSTAAPLDAARLLTQLQNCWTLGGNPDRLLVTMKQKGNIGGWNSDDIRLNRADTGRGQVVNSFTWDGGDVDIVVHRWLRETDAFLFSRDQAQLLTLRPLQFEMLAKTGDSVKGQIVCEKSFKFEAEAHAAKFTALT